MNVVIKRRVAAHNIDALNRAVVATVDLENGSIFTLSARSENEAEGEVWKATQPTVGAKNVWMAKSSEVTITTIGKGDYALQMKGIVEDPRMFTNVKGLVFDAFKPQVGDIIEMTLGDDEKEYLVADASYNLKADTAAGNGFAMHKVGTSILHIGSAKLVKTPVKTYIYEVVAN